MRQALWALTLLLLAAPACSDETQTGQGAGNPPVDNGPAPDAGQDAEPEPMPDVVEEDEAPEERCGPGQQRCEEDGGRSICQPDGRWRDAPCPERETCEGLGECVLDPALCRNGELICLDDATPGACLPGEGWIPLDPCPPEEACSEGLCRSRRCVQAERNASYLGCDYFAVDLPNLVYAPVGGTPDSPLGVVLTNPSPTDAVRFSVFDASGAPAALVGEVTIEPPFIVFGQYPPVTVRSEIHDAEGRILEVAITEADGLEIPPEGLAIVLLETSPYLERTVVRPQAVHIQTDNPIAAYQFGPYCCNYSFSNDASLLFPIPTLGREYIYLGVPSWNTAPDQGMDPPDNSPGMPAVMTLIGTEPQTGILVTLPEGAAVQPDNEGRVSIQGREVRATLGRGEVLHLFSEPAERRGQAPPLGVDLSGALIEATAPVSVFSGHLCTFYPQEYGACDHLEEQLFPTDTWGSEFALVPPVLRTRSPQSATEAVYWKIVARSDTRISLSVPYRNLGAQPPGFVGVPDCVDKLVDGQTIALAAGEVCEFGTRQAVEARSDGPIMIMGIISGQDTTGFFNAFGAHAGDPAIFLVPPRRQYRNEYAFLAPTTYFNDYLTVVTQPEAEVLLDGDVIDMSDAQEIPGAREVYKHLLVGDGPHKVSSSHPLGILVFAFDDYVSYAYTGGLNLIKR